MQKRIDILTEEIAQFQAEGEKKQKLIMQYQQELSQIHDAIMTRQGGIIELKKLEKQEDEPDNT